LNKLHLRWLLKEKYNWPEPKIAEFISCPYKFKNLKSIKSDVEKIKSGQPLAYVIGFVQFFGCKIDLCYKPLIPRPETEFLASRIIPRWIASSDPTSPLCSSVFKILDLCCGSGCIGISLLKKFANTHVDFVDIDELALKQTKKNLKINKIARKRFSVIKSNLFRNLKNKKYDLIITNPPYLTGIKAKTKQLEKEPIIALAAGPDGLFFTKEILQNFNKYLLSSGHFFLEFDTPQKKAIQELLKSQYQYQFLKDQFEKIRFLHLTQPQNKTIVSLISK